MKRKLQKLLLMIFFGSSISTYGQNPTEIWLNEFISRIETCREACYLQYNDRQLQPLFDFFYDKKIPSLLIINIAFVELLVPEEGKADVLYFGDIPIETLKFYLTYNIASLSPTNLYVGGRRDFSVSISHVMFSENEMNISKKPSGISFFYEVDKKTKSLQFKEVMTKN